MSSRPCPQEAPEGPVVGLWDSRGQGSLCPAGPLLPHPQGSLPPTFLAPSPETPLVCPLEAAPDLSRLAHDKRST